MKKRIILTESELINVISRIISNYNIISEEIDFNKLPLSVVYNDQSHEQALISAGLNSNDPYKDPNFKKYYPDNLSKTNTNGSSVYYRVKNEPSGYSSSTGSGKNYKKVPYNEKGYQNTKPTKPLPPKELGDVNKVKAFQDWMDQEDPKWLNGRSLLKGRGYGTFGPKTTAAWNKYKGQYLNTPQKTVDPNQNKNIQNLRNLS